MGVPDSYMTLKGPSEGLYKEKGSRFIAHAFPAENEEMAKEILESLRKRYHDARHHCFAYRLGPDGSLFRYGDDGEPSGTAGKPIYGQLLSFGLTKAMVVVIRYFGGIKLGTGGLIRAYKAAARDALEHAEFMAVKDTRQFIVEFSYEKMHDINRILREEKVTPAAYDLGDLCRINLNLGKEDAMRLIGILESLEGVVMREELT